MYILPKKPQKSHIGLVVWKSWRHTKHTCEDSSSQSFTAEDKRISSQPILREHRPQDYTTMSQPKNCSATNTPGTKKTSRGRHVPTVLTRSLMLTCLFLYTWPAVNCEMSPTAMNISLALEGHPSYTTIVQAFITNNLMTAFTSGGQPLTLLAPENSAFDALPTPEADSIERENTGSYVLRVSVGYVIT